MASSAELQDLRRAEKRRLLDRPGPIADEDENEERTRGRLEQDDDSELEGEDYENWEPRDRGGLQRKRSKNSLRSKSRKTSFKDPEAVHQGPQRRRRCMPTKLCCGLIILFTATTVLLLAAGGIWAGWKTRSYDGMSPPWYPSPKGGTVKEWADSYNKAATLVRQMTLVEKVNVTTGTGWTMGMCVGNTGPVPRLHFPSLCLQDGPLGLRFADNSTAFPAGVTVGATWDRELMYQRGRAHGKEARLKGIHVLLGPSMGPLGRLPAGGRNWEGFGSDPVLQGIAAAETIRGIQDEGVQATAKHFVANEQEHFRQAWAWGTPYALSSNVDDRTLHELYAWPFADSVRAGVASVMCSYNQVNNSYACQNSKLMNGILKDELGFQGWVQSDWLAQRSGVASALAGLDVTMPGDGLKWQDAKSLWGEQLTKAVLNGSVPVERLDDMVTRVVASWYQLKQDDTHIWPSDEGPNFSSWTYDKIGPIHYGAQNSPVGVVNKFVDVQGSGKDFHGNLARRVAAAGMVLVKNSDNFLPLSRKGSPSTTKNKKFRVGIFGEDARINKDGINACKDQGCNDGTIASGWGSGAVNFPYLVEPAAALKKGFEKDSVVVTEWLENSIPKNKKAVAEEQDVCIVFAMSDGGEGYIHYAGIRGDRNDLFLQKDGDALISSVAESCGRGKGDVIVVLHTIGPVILEEWINLPNVKAVLFANLPGQESGNALVDVLFGDVNPSGRLPYTIAKKEEDYGPDSKIKYLPNPLDGLTPQQNFSEGLYIDYRYFDKNDIEPRYEFGYGLSYTTFKLSDLKIETNPKAARAPLPAPRPKGIAPPHYSQEIPDPETALAPEGFTEWRMDKYIYPWLSLTNGVSKSSPQKQVPPHPPSPAGGAQGGNPDLYTTMFTVSTTVRNTGARDGAAVAQLYIEFPQNYTDPKTREKVDFPIRQLRGFEKARLKSGSTHRSGNGEERVVKFEVSRRDLSYWDVRRQNWVMPKGEFGVRVGFSSRDEGVKGVW